MVRERNTIHPLLGRVGDRQVLQVIGVGCRVDRSRIGPRVWHLACHSCAGLKKKANSDLHISGVAVS